MNVLDVVTWPTELNPGTGSVATRTKTINQYGQVEDCEFTIETLFARRHSISTGLRRRRSPQSQLRLGAEDSAGDNLSEVLVWSFAVCTNHMPILRLM